MCFNYEINLVYIGLTYFVYLKKSFICISFTNFISSRQKEIELINKTVFDLILENVPMLEQTYSLWKMSRVHYILIADEISYYPVWKHVQMKRENGIVCLSTTKRNRNKKIKQQLK